MVWAGTGGWPLAGWAFQGTALHMGEGEGNAVAPLMRQEGRRLQKWLNPGIHLLAAGQARLRCSVPPAVPGGRGR